MRHFRLRTQEKPNPVWLATKTPPANSIKSGFVRFSNVAEFCGTIMPINERSARTSMMAMSLVRRKLTNNVPANSE